MKGKLGKLAIFCMLILLTPILGLAQVSSSTGSIRGTVTDPNGAVIPGAKVSLSNPNFAIQRDTTTNAEGSYEFPLIKPASGYRVEITAPGFQREILEGITVQVTETANANVTLKLGGTSEEVVVTGDAQPVQTTSATLGGVLGPHVVSEIPLPTRNIFDLMATDAGVAATLTSPSATILQGAQALMVAGSRATSNNYTLNGVDANNFEFHTLANGIVPVPNPDAVQEFRTQTSLYDATSGFSAGGNISVVVKSGTNDLHGNAYEYNRLSALSANDFFFNRAGAKKPFLVHNQFGGSLGGPFPGKKTFWFANYEGIRERNGVSGALTGFLPVLPQSRDAASLAQAFGLPVSAIDPVAIKVLNAKGSYGGYLVPSGVNAPVGQLGEYAFSSPAQYSTNQLNTKVDHDMKLFGGDNHVSGSLLYSNGKFINPGGASSGTFGQPYQYIFNNNSFSLNDVLVLNSKLVNEAVFGFAYNQRDIAGLPGNVTNADVGINRFNESIYPDLSNFYFTDQSYWGGYAVSAAEAQHNASFDFRDTMSYIHGKHSFRFGFETRAYQFNFRAPTDRGYLYFLPFIADSKFGLPAGTADLSFRDFLIGAPLETGISSGLTDFGYRAKDYIGFFQDDYHVTRRLTLNLGLRYDYLGQVSEIHGQISNFDPTLLSASAREFGGAGLRAGFIAPAGAQGGFGTAGVSPSTLFPPSKIPFTPRVSLAYDVLGNGKLAVRGGYGIYLIRAAAGGPLQTGFNPPFNLSAYIDQFTNSKLLANPFPTLPLPSAFPIFPQFPTLIGKDSTGAPIFDTGQLVATTVDRNLKTGYSQNWNVTVQYEFRPKWTVELGYLGSHSLHLLVTQNTNSPLFVNQNNPAPFGTVTNDANNAPLRVPIPAFAAITEETTNGKSFYNAMLLTVSHRFGHGLFLKAAYTFSKNLDNYNASTGFDIGGNSPGNQYNPDLNYGLAAQDQRHRLVILYTYDLPGPKKGWMQPFLGGWSLSGIATLQSGFPGTILQNTANALSGLSGYGLVLPDCQLVTSGSVTSKLNHYLNPACVSRTPTIGGGQSFGPTNPYGGSGDQTYIVTPGQTGSLTGPSTRGAFRNPFQKRWDAALHKQFPVRAISETANIEFRAEFFKVTNTPIFNGPSDTTVGDAAFGRITSTIDNTGRQIQFALRLSF